MNSVEHGFVRTSNGTITTFDPSGSVETEPASVNVSGAITGTYLKKIAGYKGFVRTANGTITTFKVPQSIDTFAESINSGGAVTGYFADNGSVLHGFVRTP
jgi:hypothetical protein